MATGIIVINHIKYSGKGRQLGCPLVSKLCLAGDIWTSWISACLHAFEIPESVSKVAQAAMVTFSFVCRVVLIIISHL